MPRASITPPAPLLPEPAQAEPARPQPAGVRSAQAKPTHSSREQVALTGSPCGPKRGSTVENIVQDIERAIRAGSLVVGQRLVEPDMIRELGVSRGSLREALNRLSAAGLVEIVPNRGAIVRRLTRKEVADCFQIRERLEGLAAALAAERLHEGDNRERLLAAAHPFDAAGRGIEHYRRENYVIHGMIADIAGNQQLKLMIRQLWLPPVMGELRAALDEAFWQQSIDDHHRIIEAILAGNSPAAETAMRDHLRARCNAILSLPTSVFGG